MEADGRPAPASGGPPGTFAQKAIILVNVGLFLSICVSVLTLLPLRLMFVDRFQLRLYAGIAVVAFLDLSFWFAGWPGSATGITLLGIALAFAALVGQRLGLVGVALSLLMGVMVILLMLSDLPVLKTQVGWLSGGWLPVWIGVAVNVIVAILGVVLWTQFGTDLSAW
jgi:hypothetical protein